MNMFFRSVSILSVVAAISFSSGCMLLTRAQLEGKLPQVDARKLTVEASTIYGVSGTIQETDVKWVDGVKTVGFSELRITSPVGSYKRTIEGVSVPPLDERPLAEPPPPAIPAK